MRTTEKNGSLPEQIRDDLAMQIQSGIRKDGTPLPSFTQLCSIYSASLSSVNAAMRLLEKEHLIRTRSHRPALVCAPKKSPAIRKIALMTSFPIDDMHYATSPYAWLIYQSFLSAIISRGCQCMMLSGGQRHDRDHFDGVIYWEDPKYTHKIPENDCDTPWVRFSSCFSAEAWNMVSISRIQSMYQSALYFVGNGVKSVLICMVQDYYYAEMHEAFEETLCERGILPEQFSYVRGVNCLDMELAHNAICEWLDRNPARPLGVLCGGDFIARMALEIAVERGLRVKKDIYVIGFTDLPESAHWSPKLTMQSFPYHEMAETTVAMLEKRIADGKNQPSIVLNNKLIIRDT